jgi:putative transposase
MPGRSLTFTNNEYYHVFNRGSDKRIIFTQSRDFHRFMQTFKYYQYVSNKVRFSLFTKSKLKTGLGEKLYVEVICYSLMPNHFHFILRQVEEGGISKFLSQLSNSYTKYFNTKTSRTGPLLQGVFKAVRIETDEQLLHVSRYIHLNPVVSNLVQIPEEYPYSSYNEFLQNTNEWCMPKAIMDFFGTENAYKKFVEDQIDYGKTLEAIKHQLLDE